MNNLSWREQTHKCKAKGITVIDFPDTMPNQALVFNYSNYILYGGISCTPSTDKYDTKISAHNSGFIGRPNGFKSFMIYNPNTVDIDVRVYSVFDTFDISNYQRDINDAENLNVSVSEIKGALPSGNNLIGNVNIQNPLPAGGNNLGKIELVGVALDYLSKLESIRALTEGNTTVLSQYNEKLTNIHAFLSSISAHTSSTQSITNNILTKNTNIIDTLAQILTQEEKRNDREIPISLKHDAFVTQPTSIEVPQGAKSFEITLFNLHEEYNLYIAYENQTTQNLFVIPPSSNIQKLRFSLLKDDGTYMTSIYLHYHTTKFSYNISFFKEV